MFVLELACISMTKQAGFHLNKIQAYLGKQKMVYYTNLSYNTI